MEREQVFKAIERERAYQDKKWGTIEKKNHSLPAWLLIMEQQLLKAKNEWVYGTDFNEAVRAILKVTSVGVACMEQHGVKERNS